MCAAAPPAAPSDAPRPSDVTGTVDFQAIFTHCVASNSVYIDAHERSLMDRVMLSPNLAFESSRSSVEEPPTVGPDGATEETPNLPNALGRPISTFFSSRLMRYLNARGSSLVAPVVSRSWCTAGDGCAQATWVERVLMMSRAAPQSAAATTRDGFPLPTALLAIRELGLVSREVPYVVEIEGTQYRVRPRVVGESSFGVCGNLHIRVPVSSASGEVISTTGGIGVKHQELL